jgi:hypothetical protein
MKAEYIRGFFDRLCSIDVPGRAIVLTTTQIDHGRLVGGSLNTLGIECSMSVRDNRLKLRVSGQENLRRFKVVVGFKDVSKMAKLNEVLAEYGGENG